MTHITGHDRSQTLLLPKRWTTMLARRTRCASKQQSGIVAEQGGLFQTNDVRSASRPTVERSHSAQQTWCDIPLASVIRDDCHGLLIVAGEQTFDQTVLARVKADFVADTEFEHSGMRSHLLEETQAFDNPVVQVNKFGFTQPVDIDRFHRVTVSFKKSRMSPDRRAFAPLAVRR
jgi:hypothetical protein